MVAGDGSGLYSCFIPSANQDLVFTPKTLDASFRCWQDGATLQRMEDCLMLVVWAVPMRLRVRSQLKHDVLRGFAGSIRLNRLVDWKIMMQLNVSKCWGCQKWDKPFEH